MRILVLEDDTDVLEALRAAMAAQGHVVRTATDFGAALNAAREFQPELLVSDWQLNDERGDGVDAATAIVGLCDPKLILLTARDIAELRGRSGHLTVAAYLRKPLRLGQLFEAIQQL